MSAKKTDFIFYDLISKIYQHHYKDGKLPPQRDLAQTYHVSRFTVQSVLNKLRKMGIIYTIQGDGIYIANAALKNPLILNSMTERHYESIESRMIYLKKTKATSELAAIFSIPEASEVWEYQRLRIVDFQITQLQTSYLPVFLVPYIDREIIETSVYDYILELDYRIAHTITKYQAISVDQKEAKLLNCKKKTPAMKIESRGLLRDGTVFEYSNIISLDYSCTYIAPFNKKLHELRRQRS